jgi:hypothetical protein
MVVTRGVVLRGISMRTRFAVLLTALTLLWIAVAGSAGAPQESRMQLLEPWIGAWRGPGNNSGVDADLSLRFERVLGGRFVRLSLSNQIGPPATRQLFEGMALYWSAADGQLRGSWFDSQGTVYALDVQLFGPTLVAIWRDDRQPRGRSSYQLIQPDQLEVLDSVRAPDGSWREFARYRLKRAS